MELVIRPLTDGDIAAVVELSLRAGAPVDEPFETVLGERIYRAQLRPRSDRVCE